MPSLSTVPSPVRAELHGNPFPSRKFLLADKPLDQWLSMLAAHFRALGDERADLVGREIAEMARDARLASVPGVELSIEDYEARRACLRAEHDANPYPPRGSWVDRVAYLPAD